MAIDGVPLYYDDNGNLIEDESYLYSYDPENRLVIVTRKSDSQVVGQYQYDALSRRVKKTASPETVATETIYFYDDARIIEEQDTANVTLATYTYGNYIDEVLTMDRGGQTYYYQHNAMWSVVAVTDSSANVVERYRYGAYGKVFITDGAGNPVPKNSWGTPHSAIGNPWMFTGRQLDEETGLYFYRARYYDFDKGRFLQRDPLGYVDGMNLYEYVKGNPVNLLDNFGLFIGEDGKEWSYQEPNENGEAVEHPEAKAAVKVKHISGFFDKVFASEKPGSSWKKEAERRTPKGVGLNQGTALKRTISAEDAIVISMKVKSEIGGTSVEIAKEVSSSVAESQTYEFPGADIKGRKNCVLHYLVWQEYSVWAVYDSEGNGYGEDFLGFINVPKSNFKEFAIFGDT